MTKAASAVSAQLKAARDHLKTAGDIIAGLLPRPTTAVSVRAWAEAQAIVGRTLAGSNESYLHPNLQRGLCEHIAEAIDKAREGSKPPRKVTMTRISRVWMALQSVAFAKGLSSRQRNKVRDAMDLLDEIRSDMRRKAIFDAGASAVRLRSGSPKFEGNELGSMEAYTYYDGFASTHPKFENPYRSRR